MNLCPLCVGILALVPHSVISLIFCPYLVVVVELILKEGPHFINWWKFGSVKFSQWNEVSDLEGSATSPFG